MMVFFNSRQILFYNKIGRPNIKLNIKSRSKFIILLENGKNGLRENRNQQ